MTEEALDPKAGIGFVRYGPVQTQQRCRGDGLLNNSIAIATTTTPTSPAANSSHCLLFRRAMAAANTVHFVVSSLVGDGNVCSYARFVQSLHSSGRSESGTDCILFFPSLPIRTQVLCTLATPFNPTANGRTTSSSGLQKRRVGISIPVGKHSMLWF